MRLVASTTALLATFLSIGLSLTTSILIGYQRRVLQTLTSQNCGYAYEDSDLKFNELPGLYEEVSMMIQENHQFSLVNDTAWAAILPGMRGFVRLGTNGRSYGVATYHQLHCINALRFSYTVARDGLLTDPDILKAKIGHDNHCFQFIRQSILCKADDTLIEIANPHHETLSRAGFGVTHRCRNWAQVRQFVLENDAKWNGIPYTTDKEAVV